jgi:hypothetical protein
MISHKGAKQQVVQCTGVGFKRQGRGSNKPQETFPGWAGQGLGSRGQEGTAASAVWGRDQSFFLQQCGAEIRVFFSSKPE